MKLVTKSKNKEILFLSHDVFFYTKYKLLVINCPYMEDFFKRDIEFQRSNINTPLKVFISNNSLFLESNSYIYNFSYAYNKIVDFLEIYTDFTLALSYKDQEDGSLDLLNLGVIEEGNSGVISPNFEKDEVLVFERDSFNEVNVLSLINDLNKKENSALPESVNKHIEVLFYGDAPYQTLNNLVEEEENKNKAIYYDKLKSKIIIKPLSNVYKTESKSLKEIQGMVNFLFLKEVGKLIYLELMEQSGK